MKQKRKRRKRCEWCSRDPWNSDEECLYPHDMKGSVDIENNWICDECTKSWEHIINNEF